MHSVYLLLGGSTGNRSGNLSWAAALIAQTIGKITTLSKVYESAPWGFDGKNLFLNQLIVARTSLSPKEVISAIHKIESAFGRERANKQWADRIMDVDVLLYDNMIVDEAGLKIPHPQLQNRRFALKPLSDVAGDLIHPVLKKSIDELYGECEDKLEVKIFRT